MTEGTMKFNERYKDFPFSRWKGGRYRFYIYNNDIDFFAWIFENGLEKEVKFEKDKKDSWHEKDANPYYINFRSAATFMAFKLTWL